MTPSTTTPQNLIKRLDEEIKLIKDQEEREAALERLKEIAKVYRGEDEVVPWSEIVKEGRQDTVRMMSGWEGLDSLLKGFRPQQLVVISAATKSGKTSFMVDLTSRMIEHAPLWFPFEESAEELGEKFYDRGVEPPLFYSPKSMMGGAVSWIEEKIIEAIAKYNTRVVVIDHLDFVVPFNSDNHSLRVGQAMRDMKALAKKWNVVVFMICHLVKTKMDSQPTLEDLRGSASIAQEADTVILLWREMKKEKGEVVISNNVNVSVQANRRHGKTGNVKMIYKEGAFFEEEWKRSEIEEEFDNF